MILSRRDRLVGRVSLNFETFHARIGFAEEDDPAFELRKSPLIEAEGSGRPIFPWQADGDHDLRILSGDSSFSAQVRMTLRGNVLGLHTK